MQGRDAVCLHIVGTERHESRRIDRQLRGRSGRQGDPGSSRFFLSLEDDLMRLFAVDRIAGIMDRIGVQEGEVITHSMVTRAIEKAQKRVETQNFGIRKRLLEYDDVMNQQREVIYGLRNDVLDGADIRSRIEEMQERIPEFREGEHYPDLLVLSGEPSVAGAHAWLGLRKDGSLEIRNIGQGRALLQGPEDEQAREIGYDAESVEPGSLFLIGNNLEYRFQVDREE